MYYDSDKGHEKVTVDGESETFEDSFSATAERQGFYAMGRLKI